MLLALDIGNSNIHLGVFRGEKLEATWRITTHPHRMPEEYGLLITHLLPLKGVSPSEVKKAVLCSVVPPLTPVFEELCHTCFGISPLVVAAGVRTGIRILYDSPRDVGSDRVADAVAAFRLYGGPVIVVDFGTATVFDAISREGDYIGGAIAPGVHVAAEALYQSTSQLRRVEMSFPPSAIGRSTTTSIQAGLLYGYVGLVEGLIRRFQQELGEGTRVVATGGLAPFVAQQTRIFDHVNPDLTLIGLRMIYEMNVKD